MVSCSCYFVTGVEQLLLSMWVQLRIFEQCSHMCLHVGIASMDSIDPKTKCCMTGNFDNTCENRKVEFTTGGKLNNLLMVDVNRRELSRPGEKYFSIKFLLTSALYIFNNPLLTLLHVGTLLIPQRVLECSKNGPVFT